MNNNFKKASAIIITLLLLVSLSACFKQELKESVHSFSEDTIVEKSVSETTKSTASSSTEKKETETTNSSEPISLKYENGIKLLKSRKYREAQAIFEACGDYGLASDLVNVCRAEAEFNEGNFNSAIALYSKVSENTEVEDFGVQIRKFNISTRVSLVKMSGTYYPVSNSITMSKYKKKRRVHYWHSTDIWSPQYITFSYTENPNGTFNINGYVQFMRFTKYAKKRSGVRTGICKFPINLRQVTRFSNRIKLAKGVTLTYKNGKFVVNYNKTSKSGKNKIVFKSVVTYKK